MGHQFFWPKESLFKIDNSFEYIDYSQYGGKKNIDQNRWVQNNLPNMALWSSWKIKMKGLFG
jgi:hypothetical protein